MATKKAYIKQIKGITFAGKSDSNNWIVMDGPEDFGGANAGVRPKELLLIGLGGCTGGDVISILKKKKVEVKDFEINITAETAEEHPQVFTKINIEYIFHGDNILSKDVERAIELSQTKYCSVSKMLGKLADISHTYIIKE